MDILGVGILIIIGAAINNLIFTTMREAESFPMYMLKTLFSLVLSLFTVLVLIWISSLFTGAGKIIGILS